MAKMEGVWITSSLPLDDNSKPRFQVLDTRKIEVLQLLRDWGWSPVFAGTLRVAFSAGGDGG